MNSYKKEINSSLSVFESLILQGISSLDGQRSIFGLYHIMQGKRSSQTIQDAHIFRLLPFFALLPHLQKPELEQVVMHLYKQAFIREVENQVYILTYKGEEICAHTSNESIISSFDGWGMKDIARPFSLRLSLFIQSLSQLASNNKQFIPNTKSNAVQSWVHRVFPQPKRRDECREQLYAELNAFLQRAPSLERDIFIGKLSGAHRYGYTNEQLSLIHNISVFDVELRHTILIHQLIHHVVRNPSQHPAMRCFLEQDNERTLLTASAEQTLQMYKRGIALEDIAKRRSLKLSTIEDHLIEAFFYDEGLSLRPFVSEADEQAIMYAMKEYGIGKLRTIKEHIPNHISYFQIRLVLAKEGKG